MSAAMAFVLTMQMSGLSGVWERDPEQSDDAQAKMQEAFQQMQSRRGGGPGGPGGGPMPAGRRGRGGGGPGAGAPGSLGTAAEELTIEHEGGELRVDDGERLSIYYLDGEEHKRQMPNGTELKTTATIAGLEVTIEEKMRRGEILRTFELAPNGEVLIVTSSVKLQGMKDPVLIRSVYQRIPDG